MTPMACNEWHRLHTHHSGVLLEEAGMDRLLSRKTGHDLLYITLFQFRCVGMKKSHFQCEMTTAPDVQFPPWVTRTCPVSSFVIEKEQLNCFNFSQPRSSPLLHRVHARDKIRVLLAFPQSTSHSSHGDSQQLWEEVTWQHPVWGSLSLDVW